MPIATDIANPLIVRDNHDEIRFAPLRCLSRGRGSTSRQHLKKIAATRNRHILFYPPLAYARNAGFVKSKISRSARFDVSSSRLPFGSLVP